MKAEKIDNYNYGANAPRNHIASVADSNSSAHIRTVEVTARDTRVQHQPLDKAEAVRLAILRTG